MSEENNNLGYIQEVDLAQVVKKSYIDYSMSVIAGRALPDVRDGLKPVHKRILFGMHESSMTPDKPYKKCARIVGDVMGKYHPHGDSSIYDALVRLAQSFSIRYPLVEGQGNFGSIDGDKAAAPRYTECRMQKLALEMVRDINKDTVDFVPNYDGNEKEPVVLPSRFPNLLVNGSTGIAVGMATNIPPHNLGEAIDGVVAMIDKPDISVLELMQYIKGPDFPTGAIVHGTSGIREAYETGRGRLLVRARTNIVQHNNRDRIEITELPYMVNKAKLVEYIADLVKDKKITGIADITDLSDRNGLLITIDIKRDANVNVVLNTLFKMTKMQETFGVIMLALVDMRPKQLNLKEMLFHYLNHQKEVVTRRTKFELKKAQDRAHILEGLLIALDHIDEVIHLIRNSETPDIAKNELITRFNLSDIQATAILDMRLRRLAHLERNKIEDEFKELEILMNRLKEILSDENILLSVIKTELLEIKDKFSDPRRTDIEPQADEISYEDLINEEDVVVTLTEGGYIKRISADTYSSQRRGGKGIQAMNTKEDDFVSNVFVTSTHRNLLFFTNKGRVFRLKAYEIPDAGRNAKGMNLVNLLPIEKDEKIQTVISIKNIDDGTYLIMGTKQGIVKRTKLSEFQNLRKNGLLAFQLYNDDELLNVKVTRGDANLILVSKKGMAIIFNEKDIRISRRQSGGVKAIRFKPGDEAVTLDIAVEGEDLLVVTENGIGKKLTLDVLRAQRRGGQGLRVYKVNEKSGDVLGARITKDDDEILLINSLGVAIRIKVSDLLQRSRQAFGVILMKSDDGVKVVSIAKIKKTDEDADTEEIDDEDLILKDHKAFDNDEIIDIDEKKVKKVDVTSKIMTAEDLSDFITDEDDDDVFQDIEDTDDEDSEE
ncbi:MAG: DNA gyrase subunit A [Clostridiaceae bacterium]